MSLIEEMQGAVEDADGIAPVSFIETSGHFHIRIARPINQPAVVSGAPHDDTLISGGEDALHRHLVPYIDQSTSVDLAVSFLMQSGIRLVLPHLEDLLARGGRLRLLTGDYLDVTEPEALRLILDLDGDRTLHVFQAAAIPFHPKAWLFRFRKGGALVVGSSNLSRSALLDGVEWNLRLFDDTDAGPLAQAQSAFEALLARPEVTKLDAPWVEAYEARRRAPEPKITGLPAEPDHPTPVPHEIQREALQALEETRRAGYRAGLVVLATGLGKTFLAAFDSQAHQRVLFVAHREEILTQAMAAFRAVRPAARLGRFSGGQKDREAEILFASVQTLARTTHLRTFAEDAFDYIVIDEFHHAAAATYRRIIDHFEPRFLLGLTATPDRTDGGDLLGLCQENLVYRCDLWDGIGRDLLSPFRYFGVPDPVEYAQIPWRSGRFDEAALTEALATQARAANALEQLGTRGGKRAIGFCVSRLHADFMAQFARENGLRALAVHSGETSAPRASTLQALEAGEIDIVFAVDMFNEGVDVPSIDTVLMLRPTESAVIWLQQLGRGLRKSAEKAHLAVIDYIGNHRIFLTKARALLQVGAGERALREALEAFRRDEISFPPGCEITYDLEALDILQGLIRRGRDTDELDAFYRDFRERHGHRPTASEVQHAGFDPRRTGHDGWFGFVAHQGDLADDARGVLETHRALLAEIESSAMTRAYKMLVVRAMLDAGRFPGEMSVADLAAGVGRLAARNPSLQSELSVDPKDIPALRALLLKYPLKIWAEAGEGRWFELGPGTFRTRFSAADALADMVSELVDWRLVRHLSEGGLQFPEAPDTPLIAEAAEAQAPFVHGPTLWQEYMRDQIPPLFGAVFNSGSWNAGIVTVDAANAMVLLVTLEKGALASGNHYADRFETTDAFQWQTQTSTRRESRRGRIISGEEEGWTVHLFIRGAKLRDGKAAPFRYAGPVEFVGWEGDSPITVSWALGQPVPTHLHRIFGLEAGRSGEQ